jgi:hypothetical protein
MVEVEVYRCYGYASRSVLVAEHVETVVEDDFPDNEDIFADQHDGDLIAYPE